MLLEDRDPRIGSRAIHEALLDCLAREVTGVHDATLAVATLTPERQAPVLEFGERGIHGERRFMVTGYRPE